MLKLSRSDHALMQDPVFDILLANCDKAKAAVKVEQIKLCVEFDWAHGPKSGAMGDAIGKMLAA